MQEQYIKLSDLIKVKGIGEKTIQRVKETLFSPTEDKKNTYINKPKLNITIEPNNIYHGDCIEVMKCIPDNYVDSIVTDPPYELGFMGKSWDSTGIAYNVEVWKECLRVLKPGGYLLSFGGTRTYHRMACAIEDAGFIIHPMIAWIFGTGFPKATNLSKQFDKQAGVERIKLGIAPTSRPNTDVDNQVLNWGGHGHGKVQYITLPTTSYAKQWDGWYYGLQTLKPAVEPICMAQKPIDGKRMTDNVLKWGTGAINVDGCRIPTNEKLSYSISLKKGVTNFSTGTIMQHKNGRFPANVILDEEAGRLLDKQSGVSKSVKSMRGIGYSDSDIYGKGDKNFDTERGYVDKGGASRFFYCAKASKRERNMGLENCKDQYIAKPNIPENIMQEVFNILENDIL